MYLLILLTLLTLTDATPKVHYQLNPGCTDCFHTDVTLAYVRVWDDESMSELHQVWDFTSGYPTIVYIIGESNSTLNFEWKETTPIKISPSSPPAYTYATILNNLIEYIDLKDTVNFDYSRPYHNISLRNTKWHRADFDFNESQALLRMNTTLNEEDNGSNGTVSLQLELQAFDGREASYPRLIHTLRTTKVDVSLSELTGTYNDPKTRFAVRYVIVSEDNATDHLRYSMHDTIDDEYTPGVFRLVNLQSPSSVNGGKGGYMQYRPVAFTESQRDMGSSVQANVLSHNKTKIPRHSLAERFYFHRNWTDLLVQEAIFSFGDSGDGFYNHTRHITWTHTVGYGAPVQEAESTFVVSMIALSVGGQLAALILLVGAVACRRRRARCVARP